MIHARTRTAYNDQSTVQYVRAATGTLSSTPDRYLLFVLMWMIRLKLIKNKKKVFNVQCLLALNVEGVTVEFDRCCSSRARGER